MTPKSIARARSLVLFAAFLSGSAPALADFRSSAPSIVRLPTPPAVVGFGSAVARLGDVNGDGISDVVVTAPGSNRAYVTSGMDGTIIHDASAPATASRTFGAAVAATGDVDLDGTADFAVGAPLETLGAGSFGGRVFVFSGRSGALLRELVPIASDSPYFGRSVSGPGDVSGDGVPDVAVGAPGGQGPGGVVAFSGAEGRRLWSRTDAVTSFGQLVVPTPDVSGDMIADLLVATVTGDPGGQPPATAGMLTHLLAGVLNGVLNGVVAERVDVLSGATGTVLRTITDPSPHPNDGFGGAVAAVGDQDEDGVADHVIGERGANQLHVYSGDDGVLIRSFTAPTHVAGQTVSALAAAADSDGDGREDIWVGIGSVRSAFLTNAAGTVLAQVPSPSTQGAFGTSIATLGNNPGRPTSDVVVGDPAEPGGGAVYLIRTGSTAAAAAPEEASGCEGTGCDALLRASSLTSGQTTTTIPTTAVLPRPSDATADASRLASSGGADWILPGLYLIALGMAGITVLRRARQLPAPGAADGSAGG